VYYSLVRFATEVMDAFHYLILVMDQSSTSMIIVKFSKDEDKGDGQSTDKPTVVELAVDFHLQFTTDRKFTTRKQMQKWVCGEAMKLGFAAVIAKAENGSIKIKAYVEMGCQRGGSHKAYITKKWKATTTLKCNCPFWVRSYLLRCCEWSVNVIDGTHNRIMAKRLESHKYAERLKPEEAILVCEM
ncbi:FAR1-related protein, partial [Trifolium medium]|nr:FAR1-related protein [Trifolium medium]